MSTALFNALSRLSDAERKLFEAACREIPVAHEDTLDIKRIVRDAIDVAFADTAFTDGHWSVLEPILRGIGHHDARRTNEPYIVSLERFRHERGHSLTEIESAAAYVKCHPRHSTLARFHCLFPLAIISIAWQVARFGKDDILLTSNAFSERYAPAA